MAQVIIVFFYFLIYLTIPDLIRKSPCVVTGCEDLIFLENVSSTAIFPYDRYTSTSTVSIDAHLLFQFPSCNLWTIRTHTLRFHFLKSALPITKMLVTYFKGESPPTYVGQIYLYLLFGLYTQNHPAYAGQTRCLRLRLSHLL